MSPFPYFLAFLKPLFHFFNQNPNSTRLLCKPILSKKKVNYSSSPDPYRWKPTPNFGLAFQDKSSSIHGFSYDHLISWFAHGDGSSLSLEFTSHSVQLIGDHLAFIEPYIRSRNLDLIEIANYSWYPSSTFVSEMHIKPKKKSISFSL